MASAEGLRRQIRQLTNLAEGDVRQLVRDLTSFADLDTALNDVMPDLISQYGEAAGTLSAEWYDELRIEHAPAGGRRFESTPAALPRNAGSSQLVAWARSEANNAATMLDLALGGMQRRIANQSRLTVIGSSLYDPRADGWMRIGNGSNCYFCDMLISRGAVYTEATVSFGAHDDCNCGAAPSFGRPDDIFDVEEYRKSSRQFRDGERTDSALEDDARARAWIETNLGDAAKASGASRTSAAKPPSFKFEDLSAAQLAHQMDVLDAMPDTEYKRKQVTRIRERLGALRN